MIHEYGSILKIPVDFTEVAVKNKPVFSAAFACECKVGNKTYYQGVGKTKKDAKKEAARIAFEAILQSYDDDNCGEQISFAGSLQLGSSLHITER